MPREAVACSGRFREPRRGWKVPPRPEGSSRAAGEADDLNHQLGTNAPLATGRRPDFAAERLEPLRPPPVESPRQRRRRSGLKDVTFSAMADERALADVMRHVLLSIERS